VPDGALTAFPPRTLYQLPLTHHTINHIVTALGYLGDVDEDDLLPVEKDVIEAYWRRRQPEVVRHLARFPS
jgi:hypothetical protein